MKYLWFMLIFLFLTEVSFAKKPVPSSPDKKPLKASGKQLYQKHCIRCHGETGEGDGPDVKKLRSKPTDLTLAWELEYEDILQSMLEGPLDMPSFKDKLSKEELDQLTKFVQTLIEQ